MSKPTILFDVMMPEMDGFAVMQTLHGGHAATADGCLRKR